MDKGNVVEILGLTRKQEEEFAEDYYNAMKLLVETQADSLEACSRLLSDPTETIYLHMVFGWEDSTPYLLKFKKIEADEYWKILENLGN